MKYRLSLLAFFASLLATGAAADGWPVFAALDPQTTNLVRNSAMSEPGAGTPLRYWSAYYEGYSADTTIGRTDNFSLCVIAASNGVQYGAYQQITLNQTTPVPLQFSGWSRAGSVSGTPDMDYSLYIDIYYTNGQPLYGQTLNFSCGTHDWEFKEKPIVPEHPIEELYCYTLLRNGHTGTAWFDDVEIRVWDDTSAMFDYVPVDPIAPTCSLFDAAAFTSLTTDDGLGIDFSKAGGAVVGLRLGASEIAETNVSYASGFFVRDLQQPDLFHHVGGSTTQLDQRTIFHDATLSNIGLELTATCSVFEVASDLDGSTSCAVSVHATIVNQTTNDRFLTVYFALPVGVTNAQWWRDPRRGETTANAKEYVSHWQAGWGANGFLNRYPLAVLSWEEGLAMAVPLDAYRPCRFAYNRNTSQLFVAFDLGISDLPTAFPNRADIQFSIFRFEPEWGMRAALDKLYKLEPDLYGRRFTNEGIWVAFSNLSPITNISDFSIAYHETSSEAHWKYDDTIGVRSYRYVTEPWSIWLAVPTNVPNDDYDAVVGYVEHIRTNGTAYERARAEVILGSGVHEASGRLHFRASSAPWLPGNYGVAFVVNATPGLDVPGFTTNKALLDWNEAARDTYNHPEKGILDGEYVDSFEAYSTLPNYRTSHFSSATMPLCFPIGEERLAMPEVYASYLLSRDIADYVHSIDKPIIANAMLHNWAFPAHLFDMMGTETDWFDNQGEMHFPSDEDYLFKRAMCAKKPYCLLMNTDFSFMGANEVERYFRCCLFYGVYPSMFSHNAAQDCYWDDPSLYERDRHLFKKYIPLLLAMNRGGWAPVTHAVSSHPDVYIERFGACNDTYIAIRNFSASAVSAVVTVDLATLGFEPGVGLTVERCVSEETWHAPYGDGTLVVTQELAGLDTEVLHIEEVPEPVIVWLGFVAAWHRRATRLTTEAEKSIMF